MSAISAYTTIAQIPQSERDVSKLVFTTRQLVDFSTARRSVFYPRAFGAMGDGVTNDTIALQKCLTALADNNGGTMQLAGGNYLTGHLSVPPEVIIRGPGVLSQISTMNDLAFVDLTGDRSGVVDVWLNGNINAPNGRGIQIQSSEGVIIEGCRINTFPWTGIDCVGFNISNLMISHNLINGNNLGGIAIQPQNGNSVTTVTIIGNWVVNGVQGQGILIDGHVAGSSINSVHISKNHVQNNGSGHTNGGGGIWLNTVSEFTVESNWVRSNNADGISFRNCVIGSIANNLAVLQTGPDSDPVAGGVVIWDSSEFINVTGNVCYLNNGPGIIVTDVLSAPAHIDIVGNTCANNSQVSAGSWGGIQVDPVGNGGVPSYINITGNNCFDTQGGPTQGWGIRINGSTSSTDHIHVADNLLHGNKNSQFSAAGTNTNLVVVNNDGYNPVGVSLPTPGASVWTYTAGASPEVITIAAGTSINNVTIGGIGVLPAGTGANVNFTFALGPNQAAAIDYTGVLTIKVMVQ